MFKGNGLLIFVIILFLAAMGLIAWSYFKGPDEQAPPASNGNNTNTGGTSGTGNTTSPPVNTCNQSTCTKIYAKQDGVKVYKTDATTVIATVNNCSYIGKKTGEYGYGGTHWRVKYGAFFPEDALVSKAVTRCTCVNCNG